MSNINLHFTGKMFGMGASLDDLASLQAINRLKRRDDGKSFIVLLANIEDLWKYVGFDSKLEKFLSKLWAGELTVILPCSALPHLSVDGFVAFRVPSDEQLRLKLQEGAIVSTSVNVSGQAPLTSYEQILKQHTAWFDEDWVPADITRADGTPSTLVKVDKGQLTCLREGSLPFTKVQEVWACS